MRARRRARNTSIVTEKSHSVLDYLDDGKIKTKLSDEQIKALFHFLNRRDTFYQITVLVTRKVKILLSNPLVVVVLPLNALISH